MVVNKKPTEAGIRFITQVLDVFTEFGINNITVARGICTLLERRMVPEGTEKKLSSYRYSRLGLVIVNKEGESFLDKDELGIVIGLSNWGRSLKCKLADVLRHSCYRRNDWFKLTMVMHSLLKEGVSNIRLAALLTSNVTHDVAISNEIAIINKVLIASQVNYRFYYTLDDLMTKEDLHRETEGRDAPLICDMSLSGIEQYTYLEEEEVFISAWKTHGDTNIADAFEYELGYFDTPAGIKEASETLKSFSRLVVRVKKKVR